MPGHLDQVRLYVGEADGKRSLKVDALPVGPGWDGWLVISERRKSGGGQADPAEGGEEEGPF